VQRAINRHQSVEQTAAIIDEARALGIGGITVDLVYGLPLQTVESFRRTIRTVIGLGVDRAAVYNFAYLPDRVRHQRAIRAEWLPDAPTRIELFRTAAAEFSGAGYEMIGMDHFARRTDELALARADGTMQRNFMGYTTRSGCDLLAFGVSAISRAGRDFAQNAKTTEEYAATVQAGTLPVCHGMSLSDDDMIRERAIQSLMCYDRLDLAEVEREHGVDLAAGDRAAGALSQLREDGLIEWRGRTLLVTPRGRYFVRNIAMVFDAYLGRPPVYGGSGAPVQVRFSRTV
jgi:oxygen-independent coproporphyrinogen-3 oxidase